MSEPTASADTWHVTQSSLDSMKPAMESGSSGTVSTAGLDFTEMPLLFAIQALSDDTAARQTNTPRPEGSASVLSQRVTWVVLYVPKDHC